MSKGTAEYRPLGVPLAAGILALPMVFTWFVLRRGYSNGVRFGAFTYLAFTAGQSFYRLATGA